MKAEIKLNWKEILGIVLLCTILIPIVFNFLYIWDSGLAKGKVSDWFVFYGSIIGGLISGFFTYIALLLTFSKNDKSESLIKEEITKTKIRECILNNKSYFDSMDNEFKGIQKNIVYEDLGKLIEKYVDAENYDFNSEKELSSFGVDKEKYNLYLE